LPTSPTPESASPKPASSRATASQAAGTSPPKNHRNNDKSKAAASAHAANEKQAAREAHEVHEQPANREESAAHDEPFAHGERAVHEKSAARYEKSEKDVTSDTPESIAAAENIPDQNHIASPSEDSYWVLGDKYRFAFAGSSAAIRKARRASIGP
jgi:hypothetical protein